MFFQLFRGCLSGLGWRVEGLGSGRGSERRGRCGDGYSIVGFFFSGEIKDKVEKCRTRPKETKNEKKPRCAQTHPSKHALLYMFYLDITLNLHPSTPKPCTIGAPFLQSARGEACLIFLLDIIRHFSPYVTYARRYSGLRIRQSRHLTRYCRR